MVNPGKVAAASGGRAKASAGTSTLSKMHFPTTSHVTRIDRGKGRTEIQFPANWHQICNHPTWKSESTPYFREDWHANV
jgi:hypothetical protein